MIEVCDTVDITCFSELLAHLLPNRIHIHSTFRDKMNDALKVSRWALRVGAICHRLIGIALNRRATLWTAFWQAIDLFLACTPLYNRFNDLRDNFTSTLYEHPVTDP